MYPYLHHTHNKEVVYHEMCLINKIPIIFSYWELQINLSFFSLDVSKLMRKQEEITNISDFNVKLDSDSFGMISNSHSMNRKIISNSTVWTI